MVNLNDVLFQMLLEDLFERYGSMLSIHQLFIPELVLLLRRGGIEQQFMSRLSDNLAKLRDYGDVCIRKKKSNMEYLVGQSPLCSMRFLLPGSNIRVLFVYQNEMVYLLTAFMSAQGIKTPLIPNILLLQSSALMNLKRGTDYVLQSNFI